MAQDYILKKKTEGYRLTHNSKKEQVLNKQGTIEFAVGSICTVNLDANNKKIVFSDGKDTYWTINTNGFSDWYVNKENLIKIKKFCLGKACKRKTVSGEKKGEKLDKGYMVYLLESSLQKGTKLNKVWLVKDNMAGYFYGNELEKETTSMDSDDRTDGDETAINTSNGILSGNRESDNSRICDFLMPVMISYGLYPEKKLQYKKYRRFFRDPVIDPYGAITGTKEYLFFTKPDFHLLETSGDTLILNPELASSTFFKEMITRYPELLLQLQVSADAELMGNGYKGNYCTYLSQVLSYFFTGNLDLTSSTADTIDTPETIYGNSVTYRGDGHKNDFNIDFSISFKDDKDCTMYNYFKIWEEYSRLKKKGIITPPKQGYTTNRILHDQIGIYKFIVAEDGETIIYYAYICGAFPTTVPRDTFSSLTETPTYNIDWHGFHIEDMNPEILSDFNFVASNKKSKHGYYVGSTDEPFMKIYGDLAPMYDTKYNEAYRYPMFHPYVYKVYNNDGPCKVQYKLVWRQDKDRYDSYNAVRSQLKL